MKYASNYPPLASAKTMPFTVRLSEREVGVLRMISNGYSSKATADALNLSKRTIDFHLLRIFEKLGVNNRVLAMREAVRLGILPEEVPGIRHWPQ